MKAIILMTIGLVSLWGCSTFHYVPNDIIGTYKELRDDSLKYVELFIDKTSFTLAHESNYGHSYTGYKYHYTDTIATGKWEIDNKHGVLSLSTWLSTNTFIGCKVEEDINSHNDSVYFHITNPIEKQMGKRHKNIYYVIDIISSNQTLMDSFDNKVFYTNNIVMPRNHGRIQEFEIRIYTTPDYYGKGDVSITPVNTFYIPVKNMESNSFKVDIPELTYQYISYQRFKNRLVKVVNKNELIWDGVLYKK